MFFSNTDPNYGELRSSKTVDELVNLKTKQIVAMPIILPNPGICRLFHIFPTQGPCIPHNEPSEGGRACIVYLLVAYNKFPNCPQYNTANIASAF